MRPMKTRSGVSNAYFILPFPITARPLKPRRESLEALGEGSIHRVTQLSSSVQILARLQQARNKFGVRAREETYVVLNWKDEEKREEKREASKSRKLLFKKTSRLHYCLIQPMRCLEAQVRRFESERPRVRFGPRISGTTRKWTCR